MDLYLQCTKKSIGKACFKARGNPYVIAALEYLCRDVEGKDLESLSLVTHQMLINTLEIPIVYTPIAVQVEALAKEALRDMKKKLEECIL